MITFLGFSLGTYFLSITGKLLLAYLLRICNHRFNCYPANK